MKTTYQDFSEAINKLIPEEKSLNSIIYIVNNMNQFEYGHINPDNLVKIHNIYNEVCNDPTNKIKPSYLKMLQSIYSVHVKTNTTDINTCSVIKEISNDIIFNNYPINLVEEQNQIINNIEKDNEFFIGDCDYLQDMIIM